MWNLGSVRSARCLTILVRCAAFSMPALACQLALQYLDDISKCIQHAVCRSNEFCKGENAAIASWANGNSWKFTLPHVARVAMARSSSRKHDGTGSQMELEHFIGQAVLDVGGPLVAAHIGHRSCCVLPEHTHEAAASARKAALHGDVLRSAQAAELALASCADLYLKSAANVRGIPQLHVMLGRIAALPAEKRSALSQLDAIDPSFALVDPSPRKVDFGKSGAQTISTEEVCLLQNCLVPDQVALTCLQDGSCQVHDQNDKHSGCAGPVKLWYGASCKA